MNPIIAICRNGIVEDLIEEYNKNPNIYSYFQECFEISCFHGKREILHKLYEWGYPKYIDIHANNDQLFFDALFGNIEILEDIYNWRSDGHIYNLEKNINPILAICQNNRIDVIDKLLNWGLINNLNRYDNLIFKIISGYSCTNMLIKIYDYSISKKQRIDLTYDTNYVFRNACYYGQLENVKQIYYWGLQINKPIDIHCLFEQPFRNAVRSGNIEVMKQLYNWSFETHYPINMRILNEDAFIIACKSGRLHIMRQLLYWEPDIDIHHNNSECFVDACKNGSFDVVIQLYEWMLEDNSVYKLNKVLYNAVFNAAKYSHIRILHLLFTWFPSILLEFDNNTILLDFKSYIQTFITKYINCIKKNWLINPNCINGHCNICFDEQINVLSTPCLHTFCKQCIFTWLFKSIQCPICRQIL